MRELQILLIAVFFCFCHWISPRLFDLQSRARRAVSSFSGGLAAAYVFLHLLPEIDEGGRLLGPRIYFVVLVGLAIYYAIETIIHRTRAQSQGNRFDALLHFAMAAIYTSMLQFTLGEQLPQNVSLVVVFTLTMGLHLISTNFSLQEEYGNQFVHSGRIILIGAVVAGYALGFVRQPHEDAIDVITALLAGFMIFKVFRKELPEFRDAHLGAFVLGMAVFFVANLLLLSAE